MAQLSLHSPHGELTLTAEDGAIVALDWGQGRDQQETPLLRHAVQQLQDYFDGNRTDFDLPLAPRGTPFQARVWQSLRTIPYGQTRTYGALAAAVGSHPRAVGQAVGRNPIGIIIPCHRVVGATGLTGYSGLGGIVTKASLLGLEGVRI